MPTEIMPTDWLLRCGNGENFKNSSKDRIWGINSKGNDYKYFIEKVKSGDRLWFITSNSKGKAIAMSLYSSHHSREIGPLINLSKTNEELGWDETDCDIEVHYTDLYWLDNLGLLTHIQGPKSIRKYNEKCKVNLEVEYSNIVKYSKVTFEL